MNGFGEEGNNGVSVVRLVELGLIEAVDEDNEVLLRVDFSFYKIISGEKLFSKTVLYEP